MTVYAQDATVAPGGWPLDVYGCVYDAYGAPVPGVTVYFEVFVNPYSGFHEHDDASRPRGTLDYASAVTGSTGCARTTFRSPYVAGIHTLLGTCPYGQDTYEIWVMQPSPYLRALPYHSDYTLVGATSAQRQRFREIAEARGGNPLAEADHYHLRLAY